jgi:hypothetical protein
MLVGRMAGSSVLLEIADSEAEESVPRVRGLVERLATDQFAETTVADATKIIKTSNFFRYIGGLTTRGMHALGISPDTEFDTLSPLPEEFASKISGDYGTTDIRVLSWQPSAAEFVTPVHLSSIRLTIPRHKDKTPLPGSLVI